MLKNITEQSLTRKQFLLLIVSLLIAMIGIDRLIKLITGSQNTRSFSSGPYGV